MRRALVGFVVVAWAGVVAFAAGGCAHPVASTPAPSEPQSMDDRLHNEATAMMIALEDVRGLYLPKRPPLRALDDAAFEDACVRNMRATVWHPGDEGQWRASGQAARAEALFRISCVASIVFYEPAGDRVVIKRDTFMRLTSSQQLERVAHELVHAIQVHALPPPPPEMTSDAHAALGALVEGDASVTTIAFQLKLRGESLADNASRLWTKISAQELAALGDPEFFAHSLGARFVLELYQHGGFAAVDEAFAHPPTSTAQIIHATRYLEAQPPPANVSSRLPLPSPLVAAATTVRGEYGLRAFLSRCVPPYAIMEVGAEWDGDELTMAQSAPSEAPMGRWVTAWRSEAGAKRFSQVVGANNACLFHAGVSIAARDRVVVLVTGPDAAMRQKHAKEVLADVLSPPSR